jgi:cobalt/nickel transport system ATP-binding protein
MRGGEKIALAGANGSGKTSLLALLAGCAEPSGGEIILRGKKAGARELSAATGMLFQEPDDQLFMPTVADDAAFGLVASGVPAETARDAAMAALASLGASGLAARPPHRLSAGEKKIAALAGIFVMEPEIFLLDEPTSALDPAGRARLIEILRGIDSPMIIGTHDLDMALELCGRALVIKRGVVTEDGDAEAILRDRETLVRNGLALAD